VTSRTHIVVRRFDSREWLVYRRLRLTALADAPDAFGSTLAAEQGRADAHWEERLRIGVESPNDLPLLALADDEPAGLVWGKIDPAAPFTVHIYQMWVTPTRRRLGIGAALLGSLIEWARDRGASELVLSVTCGESPARRLYETMRFKPLGEPTPLRPGCTPLVQQMRLQIE
jgi:GNAT superfamily N-acetyltransferase